MYTHHDDIQKATITYYDEMGAVCQNYRLQDLEAIIQHTKLMCDIIRREHAVREPGATGASAGNAGTETSA